MNIGILCENKTDQYPIQILITKVLGTTNVPVVFKPQICFGQLTKENVLTNYTIFSKQNMNLVILVSDTDGNTSKRRIIENWLPSQRSVSVIIVCPDRYIEEWFVAEKDCLIKTFILQQGELDHDSSVTPKELVTKLLTKAKKNNTFDIDILDYEIYQAIAQNISITKLSRKKNEFNNFCDELRSSSSRYRR